MQLALAVAELFERGHGGDHIVAVVAGLPVSLAHVVDLLLEREPPGILRMAAIDHVADRRHHALRVALEPHLPDEFPINHGHLLARAQIADSLCALPGCDAESHAAAGAATVEPQHEPRPFRRP